MYKSGNCSTQKYVAMKEKARTAGHRSFLIRLSALMVSEMTKYSLEAPRPTGLERFSGMTGPGGHRFHMNIVTSRVEWTPT